MVAEMSLRGVDVLGAWGQTGRCWMGVVRACGREGAERRLSVWLVGVCVCASALLLSRFLSLHSLLHTKVDAHSVNTLKHQAEEMSRANTCFKCGQSGHISRDCPNPEAPRACYNCGEPGHLSRDCPKGSSGAGAARGGGACFKCGQVGHFSRECPNVAAGGASDGRACYNCGQAGHLSRDCPQGARTAGGSDGRACYNCGQAGHLSRDCPQGARTAGGRGRGSGPKTCYKCNQEGHISRDCPSQ